MQLQLSVASQERLALRDKLPDGIEMRWRRPQHLLRPVQM